MVFSVSACPLGGRQCRSLYASSIHMSNFRNISIPSWSGVWLAVLSLMLSGQAWAQAADQARAQRLHGGNCMLCHGANGESTSEVFPRLAGQNAEYVASELAAFASGARPSTAMAGIASRLTPAEMKALGRLYQQMEPPREPARDPALAAVGHYIHHFGNRFSGVPSCASCHGADARGRANLPRLANQFPSYLLAQLEKFNERVRTDENQIMHTITSRMTKLEMAAVSEYLSSKP